MNKKIAFIGIILVLSLFVNRAFATTDTIGSTANHFTGQGFGSVYTDQITASASGQLQTVGLNLFNGGNGNIQTCIYADNSGSAGNLLGASTSTASATGWNDETISSNTVNIVSGTAYWLAFQLSSSSDSVYTSSSTSTLFTVGNGYGSCPSTPSWTSQGSDDIYNLRMVYSSSTTSSTTSTSTSTSTTTTTTTSTIPTTSFLSTTISPNGLNNVNGLPALFLSLFNDIPYASVGLILLAFGITFSRARLISPALLVAGIVALLIYQFNPAIIGVASLVVVIFIMLFLYELFKPKHR